MTVRMLTAIAFSILLTGLIPVLAGSHTENFDGFAGCDSFQTTAVWDGINRRLELPYVNGSQGTDVAGVVPAPDGGIFFLTIHYSHPDGGLYLRRRNAGGNPVWPAPGVFVPGSEKTNLASLALLTNGDLLAVWQVYSPSTQVYALRYTPEGQSVWAAPKQINQGTAGAYLTMCATAALPGGHAVVVWGDCRTGPTRLYAQRINMNGEPQWGGYDVAIDPLSTNAPFDITVTADSSGVMYVAWAELATGTTNIAMTRIEPNGTVSWIPAKAGTISSTNDQYTPVLKSVEGEGLFLLWHEISTASRHVEMVRREWDGSTTWNNDLIIDSHPDAVGTVNMDIQADGSLLLSYPLGTGAFQQTYTRRFNISSSSVGTRYEIGIPDGVTFLHELPLAAVPGGAYGILVRSGLCSVKHELFRLEPTGQSAWSSGLLLPLLAGMPYNGFPSFIDGSGAEGGFSVTWGDTRDGNLAPLVRTFQDPETPLGPNAVILGGGPGNRGPARGAQTVTGNRAMVWVESHLNSYSLMGCWYDANWNPFFAAPLTLATDIQFPDLPTLDLVIDSSGRAIAAWAGSYGGDSGIYMQGFLPTGNRVYSAPVRVDSAPLMTLHKSAVLAAFPDGSITAAWIDDRTGQQMAYAQWVSASGSARWPSDKLIFDWPGLLSISSIAVQPKDNNVYAIAGIAEATGELIAVTALDSTGAVAVTPSKVSNKYDYINNVAVAPFGNDLVLCFDGYVSGVSSAVYAQRLSGGVTPTWIDKQVNVSPSSTFYALDITQTKSAACAVAFTLRNTAGPQSFMQEINGSGNRNYGTDLPMVNPAPVFIGVAAAVSSTLDNSTNIHWAGLSVVDNANGGNLDYALSNNGGQTWFYVEPGQAVVFPVLGNDLRWGVDMYCEETRQVSPVITQVSTVWDESQVAADLDLNRTMFQADDLFSLKLRLANTGDPISVEEYIILDVYGAYYFWPRWTAVVDNRTETLEANSNREETILEFTWPAGAGAASGILFYTGLLAPGGNELLGPYDWVSLSFQ